MNNVEKIIKTEMFKRISEMYDTLNNKLLQNDILMLKKYIVINNNIKSNKIIFVLSNKLHKQELVDTINSRVFNSSASIYYLDDAYKAITVDYMKEMALDTFELNYDDFKDKIINIIISKIIELKHQNVPTIIFGDKSLFFYIENYSKDYNTIVDSASCIVYNPPEQNGYFNYINCIISKTPNTVVGYDSIDKLLE